MTWDHRYEVPPHGDTARARPGGAPGNMQQSPVADLANYPGPRDGRDPGAGVVPGRFPRSQSKTLTLAAVATVQEVVRFSGRPDRIDLHSSAAGVTFSFQNRGGEVVTGPTTRAAGPYESDASYDIVGAQDLAGGGGQLVTVTGYWAADSLYN